MSEELRKYVSQAEDSMRKAMSHLEAELVKIRAGKATPQMFDGLVVDYYGSPTPIQQVGNISVADSRTITIQPWEKNMIQPIERAIIGANLGVTPQNDGVMIRIFLPPLTEERRKEIVKRVHVEAEHSRIAIRNIRRDAIEQIKKLKKDGLSEDLAVDAEAEVQKLTDAHIAQVEKHVQAKEKEVMSI
ncbi:MAG: ribosome recycling factor [Bacteroidetes bacterium]|nr:ribosome recycling factor [Bacteroidota bacterium]